MGGNIKRYRMIASHRAWSAALPISAMEDALVGGAEEEPEEPEELPLEEDEEVYMDKFQVWKQGRDM